MRYVAIDLFSGCGGLTEGMKQAGFAVKVAIEKDPDAARTYRLNHPETTMLEEDIQGVKTDDVKQLLKDDRLFLLAGCPPCQGFSSVRTLNGHKSVADDRNSLIMQYIRFVRELRPLAVMLENVPGIQDYDLFKKVVNDLSDLGYKPKFKVLNVKDFGVPQKRKRLILIGSLVGDLNIAPETGERKTVRQAIGHLPIPEVSNDSLHKITAVHGERIKKLISLIPQDGGSRKDLPEEYILDCHKKDNIGFRDIYGRLKWDDYSSTITGGCLNPSKGRFLHPVQHRAITPREAALLQSFPETYAFPVDIKKGSLSLLIGNALPPKFSFAHCSFIKAHLDRCLHG